MIAITGATGHLGQVLLRQMKTTENNARAVIRSSSDRNLLTGFCSEVREAELSDPDSLTEAFRDCDAVIHAAALIDVRRGRLKTMRKINVEGTKNVLSACMAAGVRRLIFMSSIEAIDIENPLRPINETLGFAEKNSVMEYGLTKAEASRLVAAAGKDPTNSLETILICPTGISGPWDFRISLLSAMTRKMMAGGIPATIPGGFDYVDVRDVAGAVLSAVKKGRNGEAYLVSGEYLTVQELIATIEKVTGQHRFRLPLPPWLAVISGEVSEAWSRLTGKQVLFTRGSIDILQIDARMDSDKAKRELDYKARPLSDSFTDTVAWISGDKDINPSLWH